MSNFKIGFYLTA